MARATRREQTPKAREHPSERQNPGDENPSTPSRQAHPHVWEKTGCRSRGRGRGEHPQERNPPRESPAVPRSTEHPRAGGAPSAVVFTQRQVGIIRAGAEGSVAMRNRECPQSGSILEREDQHRDGERRAPARIHAGVGRARRRFRRPARKVDHPRRRKRTRRVGSLLLHRGDIPRRESWPCPTERRQGAPSSEEDERRIGCGAWSTRGHPRAGERTKTVHRPRDLRGHILGRKEEARGAWVPLPSAPRGILVREGRRSLRSRLDAHRAHPRERGRMVTAGCQTQADRGSSRRVKEASEASRRACRRRSRSRRSGGARSIPARGEQAR